MTRRAVIVLLCCALALATISAQQTAGTARVSGVVVSSEDSLQPVRRAIVTVRGSGASGQSAITDDQGRFSIGALPAGRFTLVASKAAHVTTAYGAKGPGRPGTPVTLAAGQAVPNLRLVLPRGAAISGTVRDFTGEPASTTQVYVRRIDVPAPAASPFVPDALTDDRGEYRVYGLPPGTYIVGAVPHTTVSPTGALAIQRMSAAGVDAALAEQQMRTGRSVRTLTAASAASAAPAPSGYVAIYYPGTSVPADATPVTVAAGEDRQGVDVALNLVPLARVEGQVRWAGGTIPELTLTLTPDGTTLSALGSVSPSIRGRPGVNGSDAFSLEHVTPGRYTLLAVTANTRTVVTPTSTSMRRIEPGVDPMLWARTEIDVRGQDVSGITLQLQPAMTLSGRIAFDATALAPPADFGTIRVSLMLRAAGGGTSTRGVSTTAKSDGTFEVAGLLPGRYELTAVVPGATGPAGWWLRSAFAGGRDLLDAPLEFGDSGSLSDVVLTFTDRRSELSGTLEAAAGVPAPEYFVLVLPADRSLWVAGARRIKTTRPATDGRFSFADLPAGEYLLTALTDMLADEWQDQAFLEQIASAGGVHVSIGSGEKKTQDLRIAR